MAPVAEYKPTTQKQVRSFGRRTRTKIPYIYRVEDVYSPGEMRSLIWAVIAKSSVSMKRSNSTARLHWKPDWQMAQLQSVTSCGSWRSQSGFEMVVSVNNNRQTSA